MAVCRSRCQRTGPAAAKNAVTTFSSHAARAVSSLCGNCDQRPPNMRLMSLTRYRLFCASAGDCRAPPARGTSGQFHCDTARAAADRQSQRAPFHSRECLLKAAARDRSLRSASAQAPRAPATASEMRGHPSFCSGVSSAVVSASKFSIPTPLALERINRSQLQDCRQRVQRLATFAQKLRVNQIGLR